MKKESNFKKFRYFLAELLILIIGITASFALNEFRVNKQEQRQQKDLLKCFKANLVVDSTILHQGIKQLEGQLKNAQKYFPLPPQPLRPLACKPSVELGERFIHRRRGPEAHERHL